MFLGIYNPFTKIGLIMSVSKPLPVRKTCFSGKLYSGKDYIPKENWSGKCNTSSLYNKRKCTGNEKNVKISMWELFLLHISQKVNNSCQQKCGVI